MVDPKYTVSSCPSSTTCKQVSARAFTIKLKLCTRPYLMFPQAFRSSEFRKVIIVTNDIQQNNSNNVKMKKEKLQNRIFSTILKLTCVLSDTLIFLFGGYERFFIIMKVLPQFLFQGRVGTKSRLLSFSNLNRKEKHKTYTLHTAKAFFLFLAYNVTSGSTSKCTSQ